MDTVSKVALAIVGVALVATVVVNGRQAAQVVGAAGSAFSGALSAAERG